MTIIRVWLVDPSTPTRRIGSRLERVLLTDVDTIYVEEPWTYKDYGVDTDAVFKPIIQYGRAEGLINPEIYKKHLMSFSGNGGVGFIINPAWREVVEYFESLENAVITTIL